MRIHLKSGTSALMKLVCWHLESPVQTNEAFCHQADYVSAHIRGARVRGKREKKGGSHRSVEAFCRTVDLDNLEPGGRRTRRMYSR